MSSIYEQILSDLSKCAIQAPEGMTAETARTAIADRALAKRVLDAFTAGIRPTLSDWGDMNNAERALWQRYYEEQRQSERAELSAMLGNVAMARAFMHADNDKELRNDALELGLQLAGLGE